MATKRDSSIDAFIAWAICGLLWFYSYLAALSVGGVVMILAVLLTVLLGRRTISSRFRVALWIAFGSWVLWWVLVVAGPASRSVGAMISAGLAFLLLALTGGPGALGLPFGIGLFAFVSGNWIADGGQISGNDRLLAGIGLAVAAAALAVWVVLGLRARRRIVPDRPDQA